MRIGIDGYNLAMPHGTGVATYGAELSNAVRGLGHELDGVFGLRVPKAEDARETAFFDRFQRPVDPRARVPRWVRRAEFAKTFLPTRLRHVPLSAAVEKRGLSDGWPGFDRLFSADNLFDRAHLWFRLTGRFVSLTLPDPPAIMHWTYPVPIQMVGARNIYTLHDLVPLKLPYATLDDKDVYRGVVQGCVRAAAHLCTVSESSRADVIERFGVAENRISNTYQTAPRVTLGPLTDDQHAVEGIFGLPYRGYLLYFGAIEPKKNIGRIIEAYLSLQTTMPLVIVGARAWQSDSELRLMPGGGADGSPGTFHGHRGQTIIRLQYLPRELLTKLIRCARATVFPSVYEGFGLPVLESMQVGTPVITSTTSSLPEVAGDAALFVDPYDVGAIVTAMRRIVDDGAMVEDLAARGLASAKRFAPECYGKRLAAMYARTMETAA
ncbi:glycosyltransferase family 4 protein [Sphingomonas sp. R86521]|uniref:glycosyltransferase family 4 protein n=1 Tax=Sphingomonas sp. R86521 TaxID=3093860 RepID=UPI0036D3BBB9